MFYKIREYLILQKYLVKDSVFVGIAIGIDVGVGFGVLILQNKKRAQLCPFFILFFVYFIRNIDLDSLL